MTARRNKFEIWSEILESCLRTPRTQTWLLREIRLKTQAIKETLHFLLLRHLIEQIDDINGIKYQTTKKGEEALIKYYNLINDFFELD